MTIPEIKQLLEKYKLNEISEEDKLQLLAEVASEEQEATIKADILEALYGQAPDAGWEKEDAAAVLQSIFEAGQQPRITVIRNRKRLYRVAAAAVAAGIILTGVYITRRSTVTVPPIAVAQHSLVPGANKAMLTLADGTSIPLDSAGKGTLALQGSTRITNANGSLNYTAGGKAGPQVMYNTVTTPHGGQYQLTLADGSRVWLNAASSIRFPTTFTGRERMVEISGEAYFEIARQVEHPFTVHVKAGSKDMSVKVLGTSFNIMAYTDEQSVKTTLVDGAVQVSHAGNKSVLKPGLEASLSSNDFVIAAADLEQTLAWKDGKFRFRNTNIKTIMRQLSRWYDMQVSYVGDVSEIDLTGVISRREDADKLLTALETTQRVHFEVNGNKVTVSPAVPH